MAITTSQVRELRELTGAGMMDCKKALEATGGDMQAAVDQLRKQGMKSAAKKAARETGEGRVFAVVGGDGRRAHLVGVACETDFLAGSDKFKDFVGALYEHVVSQDPDGAERGSRPILEQPWQGAGKCVADAVQEAIGNFGENIRICGLERLENPEGRVGAYIHHDHRQGAIVSVSTGADAAKADGMLKSLCQHIVVFKPAYAQRDEVPEEEIEREKAVIRESDEVKKRPEEHREKIVQGKLGKFFAGTVLAEQPWMLDDKISVQKALEQELGGEARIVGFRLLAINQ